MISHRSQGSILLMGTVLGVVIIAAISACDTARSLPSEPAAVNSSATVATTATAIPTGTVVALSPTENATVSFQELKAGYPSGWFMDPTIAAVATEVVISNNQHLTAIALTPTTTEVPYTPEPTRTLGVGAIDPIACIPPLSGGKPGFPSCWDAYVNGAWLFVGAGFTGDLNGGEDGRNPFRGLIIVCPEPWAEYIDQDHDCMTYEMPVRTGKVLIESIAGSLVTIVPADPANHASFVFDLTTRQWVATPTPGPSPSVSISPIPSVSPLPTQLP